MFKVTIFNLNGFLETINDCQGTVSLIHSDGSREDLNKHYWAQSRLMRSFLDQNKYLRLTLDITDPRDYFKIVYYAIGG